MFDIFKQRKKNQQDGKTVPKHLYKKNGSGTKRIVKFNKTISDYSVSDLIGILRKSIDETNKKRKTIYGEFANILTYSVIPKYSKDRFEQSKTYRDTYRSQLWKMCLDLKLV